MLMDEIAQRDKAARKAKAMAESKATAPSSCSAWAPPCCSCLSHGECQRKRFWLRSEWIEWIRCMPSEGFGRYTKTEWQDWIGFEDGARREARGEDSTRGANSLAWPQHGMEGPPRSAVAILRRLWIISCADCDDPEKTAMCPMCDLHRQTQAGSREGCRGTSTKATGATPDSRLIIPQLSRFLNRWGRQSTRESLQNETNGGRKSR